MSVNDITGDPIRTKPVTDKYAKGWEGIQWGKSQQALLDEENPLQISGGAKQPPSYESEYLARSRAVIAEWWDDMPEMWRKLDELEAEYK